MGDHLGLLGLGPFIGEVHGEAAGAVDGQERLPDPRPAVRCTVLAAPGLQPGLDVPVRSVIGAPPQHEVGPGVAARRHVAGQQEGSRGVLAHLLRQFEEERLPELVRGVVLAFERVTDRGEGPPGRAVVLRGADDVLGRAAATVRMLERSDQGPVGRATVLQTDDPRVGEELVARFAGVEAVAGAVRQGARRGGDAGHESQQQAGDEATPPPCLSSNLPWLTQCVSFPGVRIARSASWSAGPAHRDEQPSGVCSVRQIRCSSRR
ncbi:hypothetical protein DSC45_29455 [Streptomyces sp. YIM 130001]|nr:hypothetical protein DSC45_29455 [Streptomyces sp. YIM 130001]